MISWPLLLHPFRWTALCRFNQARDGDGAGKVAEDVNVIFHAIDEDGLAPDGLEGTRHVGVQAGAEFRVFEKGNAVLRAEDDMQDDAGEGLRHNGAGLLRPVGALPIPYFQTQGGARSSLALGWLVDGSLALSTEHHLRGLRAAGAALG